MTIVKRIAPAGKVVVVVLGRGFRVVVVGAGAVVVEVVTTVVLVGAGAVVVDVGTEVTVVVVLSPRP